SVCSWITHTGCSTSPADSASPSTCCSNGACSAKGSVSAKCSFSSEHSVNSRRARRAKCCQATECSHRTWDAECATSSKRTFCASSICTDSTCSAWGPSGRCTDAASRTQGLKQPRTSKGARHSVQYPKDRRQAIWSFHTKAVDWRWDSCNSRPCDYSGCCSFCFTLFLLH